MTRAWTGHFLESWLPRCTIKTPAYRHSNRTRNSSKKSRTTCEHSKGCKSVNCHQNGPKLGPIRLNHRSEHSALRAWTRSHGPPRCGARRACRPHVPIAFRCFKTASPQRLANARPTRTKQESWESACTGCTKFNLGTPDTFCRAVAPLTSEPNFGTHICARSSTCHPGPGSLPTPLRLGGPRAREPESPRALRGADEGTRASKLGARCRLD